MITKKKALLTCIGISCLVFLTGPAFSHSEDASMSISWELTSIPIPVLTSDV